MDHLATRSASRGPLAARIGAGMSSPVDSGASAEAFRGGVRNHATPAQSPLGAEHQMNRHVQRSETAAHQSDRGLAVQKAGAGARQVTVDRVVHESGMVCRNTTRSSAS